MKLSVLRAVHRSGDAYTAMVGLFDQGGARVGFAGVGGLRSPQEAWTATHELARVTEENMRAVLPQSEDQKP